MPSTSALTRTTPSALARDGSASLADVGRSLLPFDGGNRSIQWMNGAGEVRQIPSYMRMIDTSWDDVPEGDDQSAVIEFEGKTFVVGQLAKDMGGTGTFASDKLAIARYLVFAALEPNEGQESILVEKLLIAVPNARNEAVNQLKQIEGVHDYTRNGKPLVATIRKVQPIDETRAAYSYARKNGMFLSTKSQLNAVLDIGAGTTLLRLYSTAGQLMREADIILAGTFDLARKISTRIQSSFDETPSLTLIMDGIEDGSYLLGTTGYSFKEAFEASRTEWLQEFRSQLKNRWGQWIPNLGEVLVIGGSAPLVEPWAAESKGRIKVATNPQTISIIGMAEV